MEADVLEHLGTFVGEWSLRPHVENLPTPGDLDTRVVFEWMPGGRFLVERWEVPIAEAPDGMAVIGPDPDHPGRFLQHYFDSRGVARVYKMAVDGAVWTLWRDEADFSALDFHQRFTGTFGDDGRTIDGTWEICHDGSTWEKDFDLTYERR